MTPVAAIRSILLTAFLFVAVGSLQAQSFEDQDLGGWYPNTEEGNYDTAAEITDERASDGSYSVEVSVGSDLASGAFVNDNQPVSAEDSVTFRVWVDESNLDQIDGVRPFAQDDSWAYETPGYVELTAGEWNEVTVEISEGWSGTNRIGLQIHARSESDTPTVYVDEITRNGTILPVELANFDVTLNGTDAVVHWQTASETNNAGFEVLHQVPEASAFQELSFVEGAGTTERPQQYEYEVADLTPGTHYFRLKQVDIDGFPHLSEAIPLDVSMSDVVRLELTGCNPFRTSTRVQYSVRDAAPVKVELYDAIGRHVRTLHRTQVSGPTTETVPVDGSDLSSGVYFLRLQTQDVTKTQRVTVIE